MNTDSGCQPRVPLILNPSSFLPHSRTIPVGKCPEAHALTEFQARPRLSQPRNPMGETEQEEARQRWAIENTR